MFYVSIRNCLSSHGLWSLNGTLADSGDAGQKTGVHLNSMGFGGVAISWVLKVGFCCLLLVYVDVNALGLK